MWFCLSQKSVYCRIIMLSFCMPTVNSACPFAPLSCCTHFCFTLFCFKFHRQFMPHLNFRPLFFGLRPFGLFICTYGSLSLFPVGIIFLFTPGLSGAQPGCKRELGLTFMHHASSIQDRRFATLHRKLFMYLINKYISLSDICLIVHH